MQALDAEFLKASARNGPVVTHPNERKMMNKLYRIAAAFFAVGFIARRAQAQRRLVPCARGEHA
jgi:hypothetical protein